MPFKCERGFFKVARRSFIVVFAWFLRLVVVKNDDFFLSIEKRALCWYAGRGARARERKKKQATKWTSKLDVFASKRARFSPSFVSRVAECAAISRRNFSRRPLSFWRRLLTKGRRRHFLYTTLTDARSTFSLFQHNRFQSICLPNVHHHNQKTSVRFSISHRSQAKQSRSNAPHPKGTHVQQGAKVGNRHAPQKSPNVSRNIVTGRDGRQRRGVGEVNQRSDEECRQGGFERRFA